MINDVLIYLLEGSICLALGTVFYRALFEKLTFFHWNRVMLLILLFSSALIPLLSFDLVSGVTVLPEILLPVFWVGGEIAPQTLDTSWILPWQEILFFVYLLGVIIASFRLIVGMLNLWIQLKSASPQVFEGYQLMIHPRFEPASFFGFILLPSLDPTDSNDQLILLHESVHCRQMHTWDLILVQLLKVIFWFNPLIFRFERLVREVHEFQADHFVTRFHSELTYSKLLLRLSTKSNRYQLVHSFNQFQTKKRIIMMTQTNTKPIYKARFILVLPLLAVLITAFSFETTRGEDKVFPENHAIPATPDTSSADTTKVSAASGKDGKEVYEITEIQPSPEGGMDQWMKYLTESLQYPEEAKKQGIEGTVVLGFIINSDGTISDVEILRGIGARCDEEAIRVIQNAPNWTPAQQQGKAVNCRMRVPIRFKKS